MRQSSENTKIREERGGGSVPNAGPEIPLKPGRDHNGAGVSLQTVEKSVVDQVFTLQPMEDPMPKQVGIS